MMRPVDPFSVISEESLSRYTVNGAALRIFRISVAEKSMRAFGKLIDVSGSYVAILEASGNHKISAETAQRLKAVIEAFATSKTRRKKRGAASQS